jgi:hypothetical protein
MMFGRKEDEEPALPWSGPQWEYKLLTANQGESKLNRLGREGWEVVGVLPSTTFLKRPLR